MIDGSAFLEEWWQEQTAKIEGCFTDGQLHPRFLTYRDPDPPSDSLWARFGIVTNPYPHWYEEYAHIAYLAHVSLAENPAFGGLALPHKLPTSYTMIRAVRAFLWNLAATGVDLRTVSSIAHWGGGCGIQSLVLRRMGCTHTEYLVDTEPMSRVQEQFLAANGVPVARGEICEGHVNCLTIDEADRIPDCDLFVALHSLSESTAAAQDYVAARGWFAPRLVMEWCEGIPIFSGTGHWAELVADLEADGRLISREEMRCRWPERLRYPAEAWGGQKWIDDKARLGRSW